MEILPKVPVTEFTEISTRQDLNSYVIEDHQKPQGEYHNPWCKVVLSFQPSLPTHILPSLECEASMAGHHHGGVLYKLPSVSLEAGEGYLLSGSVNQAGGWQEQDQSPECLDFIATSEPCN